jgi:hypothetical protein
MSTLVVLLAMVVLVLKEEILVAAVGSESDCRDAETRETALETVPTGVGALVSPGLTERESVKRVLRTVRHLAVGFHGLSLPRIVSRLAGGCLERSHVEASDVGLGSARGGS